MATPADDAPIEDSELEGLFGRFAGVPLALAVSGGADSMALLHLLEQWAQSPSSKQAWQRRTPPKAEHVIADAGPASTVQPGWLAGSTGQPPIVVLTVDHRLRPESADEARFVAARAQALGLPHQTLVWTGDKPTTGLQAGAREARYRLLRDLINAEAWALSPAHGDQRVSGVAPTGSLLPSTFLKRQLVTAHHRDDVVETFLMRLARGSGVDGLASIQDTVRRDWPEDGPHAKLTIARPLLPVAKSRLVATLRQRGIPWREDPGNANESFERVRVRKTLRALDAIGITSAAIGRSTSRLSRARHGLEAAAHAWLHEHVDLQEGLFCEIPVHGLCSAYDSNQEVAIRSLAKVLTAFGGQSEAVRLLQVEELIAWLRRAMTAPIQAKPDRRTLGGCIIDIEGIADPSTVRVFREWGRTGLPQARLEPRQSIIWDRRFEVSASAEALPGVEVRALGPEGWREVLRCVPSLAPWKLPREAVLTLPAIWHGETLRHVPYFEHPPSLPGRREAEILGEWHAWAGGNGERYKATFVGLPPAG